MVQAASTGPFMDSQRSEAYSQERLSAESRSSVDRWLSVESGIAVQIQPGSPIWLELRYLNRSAVFELTEGSRPLSIGSGLCSDLRIAGPGVALVHFEIARNGGFVWLVTKPAAHVRLNAAHVGHPRVLTERSVIEFLQHEIEIILHKRVPSCDRHRNRALDVPPATWRTFSAAPAASDPTPPTQSSGSIPTRRGATDEDVSVYAPVHAVTRTLPAIMDQLAAAPTPKTSLINPLRAPADAWLPVEPTTRTLD